MMNIVNENAFLGHWLSDFKVAVSDVRPSNDNTPNNNPDFPVCHQHNGYPNGLVTVTCQPGPLWGRYVSVYIDTPNTPLVLCEVQVFGVRCECHQYTRSLFIQKSYRNLR